MLMSALAVLLSMTVVMATGWAYQRAARNGGWTDVFWTYGTGLTCAAAALFPYGATTATPWRRGLVAFMVAIWALRLGTYVALRVARTSEDARYAELREEWGPVFQRNMFGLLIVQAPITAAISISVTFAAQATGRAVTVADLLGILIFLMAMAGEAVADRQMKAFKSVESNAGKICDQGLWAWSRHPNYFFEAMIWFAYPIIGLDIGRPWTLASLLAPIIMFAVVRFGTGVPPLEKAMLRSKGERYRHYQAQVSTLFPRPPRRI